MSMPDFASSQIHAAPERTTAILDPHGAPTNEAVKWNCLMSVAKYDECIDGYRERYGKAEGEARFFLDREPADVLQRRGNMLLIAGASLLWECVIGNGTTTGAQALTFLNGTNAYIAVGDSTTAEVDTQTDLQAAANKARQVMDATFPYHLTSGGDNAVTGATNATPIVVTCTNSYSNGDFVYIQGVAGNTAANGLWQISSVSGTAFTLDGSVGNGAYTSGGVASKRKVLVFQATFGTGSANFAWQEWGVANASTGGSMLNRKVVSLGTKTSAASWAFKAAVAVA